MSIPRLLLLLLATTAGLAHAEWTKTIECPPGRVYRDVRQYAGRDEFCALLLPGSLWVRDGPSRSWFSEGYPAEQGTYRNGRKVGAWRECDQFDRCHNDNYDLIFPQEKDHAVRPQIPVSYVNGRYVFDFSSCWSTWVTADSSVELNIYGGLIRCGVTYIPSAQADRPAGNAGYLCEIPYSVGARAFDSLDLRAELPKSGLPQFCRKDDPLGTAAEAFSLSAYTRFPNGSATQPMQVWAEIANAVDIECASIKSNRLAVRLNAYAARLVLDRIGKTEMKAEACGRKFTLRASGTIRDGTGRTVFLYALSPQAAIAARQRACMAAEIPLQPGCETQ